MISTIIRSHNEERYIAGAIGSAIAGGSDELIIVLDRCTDGTAEMVERKLFSVRVDMYPKKIPFKIIKKDTVNWKSSTAENLDLGITSATGDIIAVHDADIIGNDNNFLSELAKHLNEKLVCVSSKLVTSPYVSNMNFLYHYWEKTRDINFPREEPRGGIRLIKRSALDQFGIADTAAWDTKLDMDLRKEGFDSEIIKDIVCYDIREFSFKRAIKGQIQSGRERRKLKLSFVRMILHSIIRLRPFVIYGYFMETIDK